MLTHIHIKQFAIIESLSVDLREGMTVITGETGTGKSILIDALGLCLGDRADSSSVRHGAEQAEITALFQLNETSPAITWLREHDFDSSGELVMRRIVTAEGRSRAYINGAIATVQQCAALGELIVDIHGQHAHQSLMRKAMHRQILDEMIPTPALITEVASLAKRHKEYQANLNELTAGNDDNEERKSYLEFQIEEIGGVMLSPEALQELEQELDLLSQGESLLKQLSEAAQLCEHHSDGVNRAVQLLESGLNSGLTKESYELLSSAAIQIDEARRDIERISDRVDLNPERLQEVNTQLDTLYDMARKYRVRPEELEQKHNDLQAELDSLTEADARIAELQYHLKTTLAAYQESAVKLSAERALAAQTLEAEIQEQLQALAMPHCRFAAVLTPRESASPSSQGNEEIEFRIATQAQGELKPLTKIASGGELSRISLAIQVVTAAKSVTPTLIFDEVDVGIGGATAEIVGQRLRALTQHSQVLCVTHLAQVASQGHNQLRIAKDHSAVGSATKLVELRASERVEEIARMLGGVTITDQTRAHAAEMLQSANRLDA
jgi:DNA repair protein RecN (Recombination protein N)